MRQPVDWEKTGQVVGFLREGEDGRSAGSSWTGGRASSVMWVETRKVQGSGTARAQRGNKSRQQVPIIGAEQSFLMSICLTTQHRRRITPVECTEIPQGKGTLGHPSPAAMGLHLGTTELHTGCYFAFSVVSLPLPKFNQIQPEHSLGQLQHSGSRL